MPNTVPFFQDWTFWAMLISLVAVLLSQLPPIRLWRRPARLVLEVYSQIHVSHNIGNPVLNIFVLLSNHGWRSIDVRSMKLAITRNGGALVSLFAQSYFEQATSTSPVLFVPTNIQPESSWKHAVQFTHPLDRQQDQAVRRMISDLRADVMQGIARRPPQDLRPISARPELVAPITALFERQFIWSPGEYELTLSIETVPTKAATTRSFRFTLFEVDTGDLRSLADDYHMGAGIHYVNAERPTVMVQIAPK